MEKLNEKGGIGLDGMGKGHVCKLQTPHLSPAKPGPQHEGKRLSSSDLWSSQFVKTISKMKRQPTDGKRYLQKL